MKARSRVRASEKSGLPPGTLVYIGEERTEAVEISIFSFSEKAFEEKTSATVEDCVRSIGSPQVSWINVTGLHDLEMMRSIGEKLDIHPLALEDILNTEQRPKLQDLDDSLFLVLKMVRPLEKGYGLEQVSLILKGNCVITFQEQKGDVFEPVRERIRSNIGKVRKAGADYLMYALIDAVVDGYFPYLEYVSESLDTTESRLIGDPSAEVLRELHLRKRELIWIRKNSWPMRDIVHNLVQTEMKLVTRGTNVYLRDVHDHVMRIVDTTESLRDVVAGLLELYLTTSSSRTNDVMKVLTMIATIFIPLTFVAGVYGMNFVYMPELAAKAGYPIVLAAMALIAGGMVLYFKKKKWL
ncbi:MAG: magnesium/cobalt transporter CorA [Spirochaetales bacterium]|nr:magnesium/cobalt transporter CorA [Spirochaetales bacterium]